MKRSSFILLALVGAMASAQAVTLTQWNFNNGDANGSTGTTTPTIGAGSAALVGGATATFASGNSGTGSSDPELSVDDTAWNLSTWAAQGTGSGSRGARFNVSTLGFQDIVVTWDNRHSNTASRFVQFEYTLDGTNFTSAGIAGNGIFEAATGGDQWYNSRSVDLTSIAGANNNANFGFRVVSIFAPTTTNYAASSTASSYGVTGTLRYDMVTVAANPVPEPASMAALGLGVAALLRRRMTAR